MNGTNVVLQLSADDVNEEWKENGEGVNDADDDDEVNYYKISRAYPTRKIRTLNIIVLINYIIKHLIHGTRHKQISTQLLLLVTSLNSSFAITMGTEK